MKERFGQYQAAVLYRAVEARAKAAMARGPVSPQELMRTAQRYRAWFNRQMQALAPAREGPGRDERDPPGLAPGMER